jgi:hypothetical protein
MASQLNGYHNFIDIRNKEGQALVSNAVDKFISPLVGDERIQLLGEDFQKMKDNLLQLGSRYGYDYLIKHCATVRTVIPEIVADLAAVPPIDGVPEEILYTNSINILEHYFLIRGDITILWDSDWSRGLVLCVLAREKNLKVSICFKLTNECWKTFYENYGKS